MPIFRGWHKIDRQRTASNRRPVQPVNRPPTRRAAPATCRVERPLHQTSHPETEADKQRKNATRLHCVTLLGWSARPYPPIHPNSSPPLSYRVVVGGSGKQRHSRQAHRNLASVVQKKRAGNKRVKLTPTRAAQRRKVRFCFAAEKGRLPSSFVAFPSFSLFFNSPPLDASTRPRRHHDARFLVRRNPISVPRRSCMPTAAECGTASFVPPALLCLLRVSTKHQRNIYIDTRRAAGPSTPFSSHSFFCFALPSRLPGSQAYWSANRCSSQPQTLHPPIPATPTQPSHHIASLAGKQADGYSI
ncbi:hypothetical protein MAPG_10970 [Magnaporthiopsis poae ATCC 64411]|uniref:Uncharacterized protein n=1 Tax=Magnaporthiopsis poae (strain ATCC 64411 / 73-15) TaxID=644358 RepID=A0A0C4EE08_MAGP6|nr:hypothetical protein MAPG_10970 [Magnaporthiopsis poae ATCC 64411]